MGIVALATGKKSRLWQFLAVWQRLPVLPVGWSAGWRQLNSKFQLAFSTAIFLWEHLYGQFRDAIDIEMVKVGSMPSSFSKHLQGRWK